MQTGSYHTSSSDFYKVSDVACWNLHYASLGFTGMVDRPDIIRYINHIFMLLQKYGYCMESSKQHSVHCTIEITDVFDRNANLNSWPALGSQEGQLFYENPIQNPIRERMFRKK